MWSWKQQILHKKSTRASNQWAPRVTLVIEQTSGPFSVVGFVLVFRIEAAFPHVAHLTVSSRVDFSLFSHNWGLSCETHILYFVDKENRNNRFEGKRVLDARKPQDGPRENREDRNNRRNKPDGAGDSGAEKRGERGERGGRGGRGGPRGGRGGPGGRGGIRGKRDFDRKSGDDKT